MALNINGIEGMTYEQIHSEIARGGKFVIYSYCVSLMVLTFRRNSPPQFVRAGQNPVLASLPWTLTCLCCGWWGFPWGQIWTPMALYTNFRGGTEVTDDILGQLSPFAYSSNPIVPGPGRAEPKPTDSGPRNP